MSNDALHGKAKMESDQKSHDCYTVTRKMKRKSKGPNKVFKETNDPKFWIKLVKTKKMDQNLSGLLQVLRSN